MESCTPSEVKRFRKYWGNDDALVKQKLLEYTEFRNQNFPIKESAPRHGDGIVPEWVVMLTKKDGDGNEVPVRNKVTGSRIVWVYGGIYDSAVDAQTYCAAFANFMEEHLARDSDEVLTVIIDTREGHAPVYKNPTVIDMGGFLRAYTSIYQAVFPGRVDKIIIAPMPYLASLAWDGMSYFLPESLVKVISFVSGDSTVGVPLPDELSESIAKEDVPQRLDHSVKVEEPQSWSSYFGLG